MANEKKFDLRSIKSARYMAGCVITQCIPLTFFQTTRGHYFSLSKLLLFSICWCLTQPLLAQLHNLDFEIYNTNHGLPQNHVYCIAQDKTGFMWFGTDDGLSRFDGHDFKVFKHKEDTNSITANSIRALMVDPDDGSIWVGTNNGVCKYFPETETFKRFKIDYEDPMYLNGSQVSGIFKHPDGSVWITYLGDGVDVIQPDSPEVLQYTIYRNDELHLKDNHIAAIAFMEDGNKILGALDGPIVITDDGKVMTDEEAKIAYPWIDGVKSIRSLLLSADKERLWIGTEVDGLYEIEIKTGAVRNYNKTNSSLDFNYIVSLHEDAGGYLWIGSESIYILDYLNHKLTPYHQLGIQGNVIVKNTIYSIFEDKDHNVWLGSFRLGVLKYNPKNSRILHFKSNQGPGSIESSEILCFLEDKKNQVWVGTGEAGLFRLREDRLGFYPASLNEAFSSRTIKCMYNDPDGYLWLGTWDGGLMKYHPGANTLKIYHPEKKNFRSLHVWDIKGDTKGNLWLGTLRDGLCYFSPKTGAYTYYQNIPGDSTSLINNDVLSLHIDKDNTVWVGTGYGLSVLRAGSDKFDNLLHVKVDGSNFSMNVYCLYEDTKGRIWLGANGIGIVVINKDLKVEKVLTVKDGLPTNMISSIQPDLHNTVWVSTNAGLAKVNPNNFAVTEVPHMAGFGGKEFLPRSSLQTADDILLFGGVHGFNMFHPDSLTFDPLKGNVVFTSLRIFNEEISPNVNYHGRKILTKSITETDALNLSYQDYSFTISFAQLTYNWQENVFYSYQMENLDNEWQYTNSERRFLHYTNLSPGEYVLKVRASLDGENWSDNISTLRIYIEPPWWAANWFRIGSVLLLGGILFTFYKLRVRLLKRQQMKLEELVAFRTQELRQSNMALRIKNEEIQALHDEVADQKFNIEQKNDELHQINEELEAQRDALEAAQEKLKTVNISLEELVNKRTAKLNETLRELETFLYRASHDLRGPISSMLGILQVARIDSDAEPFTRTYAEHLNKSIQQLERTLYKLIQKHSIQRRKVAYELITKDTLKILLDEITHDLYSFRKEDFDLTIGDSIHFQADRILLTIMLSNLLENAFFFSARSRDKKVTLNIQQTEKGATIIVADNGPGIRPDVQEKMFTMFYRGNELSTGNGLGLYLVKSALRKMNGKITVDTAEGIYSRFIVSV